MPWVALDSAQEFGSLLQSGDWYIRHYVDRQTLGCGIVCARLYREYPAEGVQFLREFAGDHALNEAQNFVDVWEARAA